MKKVSRTVVAFLFCVFIPVGMSGAQASQSPQSLPDRLKGAGLLLLKDASMGFAAGNVCLDLSGTGVFSADGSVPSLANSGTIAAGDIADFVSGRMASASAWFRKKCVAALFEFPDKSLTDAQRESLRKAVAVAGADLSSAGVHPLADSKIYFVPDGSGNFVKNPQAVILYDSGKIMELDVAYQKSYRLKIPDGRTVDVGHAMYHENGMVSFVSTDSIGPDARVPMRYAGQDVSAFSVRWDPEGKIGGIGFDKGSIVLKLPDGTETTEANGFSYWTYAKKPGVWTNNETPTNVSFRYGNSVKVKLPDGQTIDGNISSVFYYDDGSIQAVSVYPNGKPIRWTLARTQPVGFGEKWEKKVYWERVSRLIPTEKTYAAGTVIEARGGLQFTPEGELISCWDRNNS